MASAEPIVDRPEATVGASLASSPSAPPMSRAIVERGCSVAVPVAKSVAAEMVAALGPSRDAMAEAPAPTEVVNVPLEAPVAASHVAEDESSTASRAASMANGFVAPPTISSNAEIDLDLISSQVHCEALAGTSCAGAPELLTVTAPMQEASPAQVVAVTPIVVDIDEIPYAALREGNFDALPIASVHEEAATSATNIAIAATQPAIGLDPSEYSDSVADAVEPRVPAVPAAFGGPLSPGSLRPRNSSIVAGIPADLLEETVAFTPQPRESLSPAVASPSDSVPQGGAIVSNPRVDRFLGRPLAEALASTRRQELSLRNAPPAEAAQWLVAHRRPEAALRLLAGCGFGEAACETEMLRLRCHVTLRKYSAAADVLARLHSLSSSSSGEASGRGHPSTRKFALPFEAQIIEAQLPCLLNPVPAAFLQALGQVQDLWRWVIRAEKEKLSGGPNVTTLGERLLLLRTLSRVAVAAGYGELAEAAIRNALVAAEAANAPNDERCRISSLLGRHQLAVGNIAAASEAFEQAHHRSDSVCQRTAAASLDAGYLAIGSGNHPLAQAHLNEAANIASKALDAAQRAAEDGVGTERAALLEAQVLDAIDDLVAAENNLAVCRLYTQELRLSLQGLEDLVRRDPALFLRRCVAQNLCALYEFTHDTAIRRATLCEVAAAFQLEDFEPKAFDAPGS